MKVDGRIFAATVVCLVVGLAAVRAAAGENRSPSTAPGEQCVECHSKTTPNVVNDWKLSKHSAAGIGCEASHGSEHSTAQDASKAKIPTPETCGQCHADRVEQFKKGKHAIAWAAMEAMPTIHYQPMAMTEGMGGCGGCHKIGETTLVCIRPLPPRRSYAPGTREGNTRWQN
jgi:hydroxylamine dehydrogenase